MLHGVSLASPFKINTSLASDAGIALSETQCMFSVTSSTESWFLGSNTRRTSQRQKPAAHLAVQRLQLGEAGSHQKKKKPPFLYENGFIMRASVQRSKSEKMKNEKDGYNYMRNAFLCECVGTFF